MEERTMNYQNEKRDKAMTKNEEQILIQIYENLSAEIKELKNSIPAAAPTNAGAEPSCCTIPSQQKFIDIQEADNKNIKETLWHVSRILTDMGIIMNGDKVPRWLRELNENNTNLRSYAGKLDDMIVELQTENRPLSPNAHIFSFKFEFKNRRILYSFIGILMFLLLSLAANFYQSKQISRQKERVATTQQMQSSPIERIQ